MAYEGFVDVVNPHEIVGWTFDDKRPNDPLAVEILVNGAVVATIAANQYRQDLKLAGKGNGKHGFSFRLESNGLESNGESTTPAARLIGERIYIPLSQNVTAIAPRYASMLAHPLERGLPMVDGVFSVAAESADESQIVTRVIEAFHRAVQDDPQRKSRKRDMWSEIDSAYHHEIGKYLRKRDVRRAAEYLRNAHAKDLTWGLTQGEVVTRAFRTNPIARQAALAIFMDALASLGEGLGLANLEAPEQRGQWCENLYKCPCDLVNAISAQVGFDIVLPQVIDSYFGIRTSSGPITLRDCCGLLAALRLRDIASEMNVPSPRICEIGGGMGGVAYYAARLGAAHFTLIDLPIINALQGYFLLRALGTSKVRLYGEEANATAVVSILPTYRFANSTYDFLLNMDSFPEMHQDYAIEYLRQARNVVSGALLSINQESRAPDGTGSPQRVVGDLVNSVGGYRRIYRARHWIRPGYAEELYRIEKP